MEDKHALIGIGEALVSQWILLYVAFLHNPGYIATVGNPKLGLCPTLIELLQGFFIVHSAIDSTAHSRSVDQFCALQREMLKLKDTMYVSGLLVGLPQIDYNF